MVLIVLDIGDYPIGQCHSRLLARRVQFQRLFKVRLRIVALEQSQPKARLGIARRILGPFSESWDNKAVLEWLCQKDSAIAETKRRFQNISDKIEPCIKMPRSGLA